MDDLQRILENYRFCKVSQYQGSDKDLQRRKRMLQQGTALWGGGGIT